MVNVFFTLMSALPDSEHDGISDFLLGLFKENSTSLRAVLEALRVLSLSKGQVEKIRLAIEDHMDQFSQDEVPLAVRSGSHI